VLTLGAKVNVSDGDGNTALHLACYFGQWDAALLLVSRGANVLALNNLNATPLLLSLLACRLPPSEVVAALHSPAVAVAKADGGVTLLHALARLAAEPAAGAVFVCCVAPSFLLKSKTTRSVSYF
jgi:ankyrin repeat protein